jgi:hypothetical protein
MNETTARSWLASLDPQIAARWLADVLPLFADDRFFDLFEAHGVHLLKTGFLSPIPVVGELDSRVWETPSDLVGVDMNVELQRRHLLEYFPRFRSEYDAFRMEPSDDPDEFYLDNTYFSGTDALVLHCMIRHYRPQLVIEVGSGFSTKITARALALNGIGEMECVEPYPTNDIRGVFPAVKKVHVTKVEDIDLEVFLGLTDGDVLFIDSSHVSRIGGDVNFLYLEVLPRLAPGVLVHIHDIFLPFEYKEEFLKEYHLFWNEQYMFHAFMAFNSDFEVLFANSFMSATHPNDMRKVFAKSPWWGGGSFWIRRRPAD